MTCILLLIEPSVSSFLFFLLPEVLVEHRDEGLGGRRSCPHFAAGGSDAEMSLKLVHGKLVDDAPVHFAQPCERRSSAVEVERQGSQVSKEPY
jgi:hypothetical protein